MQRRIRRHLLATVAGGVTLGLVLTACGGGGGGGGGGDAEQAKGPITIWYSNNEQEVAWGKKMVAAWNSANPDQLITGQEIPAGKSSEEVIGAAVTAGTAPCLIFNTAPSAVGQLQRQGGLVDLSTFPDGNSYIEGRSGEVAAAVQGTGGWLLPAAVEVQPGDDLLQQGDPGEGGHRAARRSCPPTTSS